MIINYIVVWNGGELIGFAITAIFLLALGGVIIAVKISDWAKEKFSK